jgi:glycine cleavage system H protein
LPKINDQIRQGNFLARLIAADEMAHTAWSALSGRVVDLNRRVQENPQLLNCDPLGEGWLLRLMPDNLENEILNLSQG